ncbi:MAG: pseudouridine synthase [Actinomycetaceae bacterium]
MTDPHTPDGVRLQKVLAGAGVASRRASEDLIAAGRVSVDGQVVRELGTRVDPATAVIHVDGARVQLDDRYLTLVLNKPRGVVSTMDDPDGRASLAQYVEGRPERLFHVGRLDADSEGLLLLTNDGDLAHRLTHPSFEVPKTYLATVEGRISKAVSAQLREGLELEDGFVRPNEVTIKDTAPEATLVEIVLHEGRNHIVRRMFEQVGHPVTRLLRTRIGSIVLGDLRPGRTRAIAGPELGALMASVGM